jgi:hypothetical protein
MRSGQRRVAGGYSGYAAAVEAQIAKRCEGPKARAATKKKARRRDDAPSNKTYGNCLLGFHCSQKHPAETRANACFPLVAGYQQEIAINSLSTGLEPKYLKNCSASNIARKRI